MSIESIVAGLQAHKERVAAILAETGGEIIHPDHYAIREALRTAVYTAIDNETASRELPRMCDGELPALFRTVDAIAERIFLKSVGL